MCGRFAMDDRVNEEITKFVTRTGRKPQEWAPDWASAFNIAPTEDIPILLDSAKTGEKGSKTPWFMSNPDGALLGSQGCIPGGRTRRKTPRIPIGGRSLPRSSRPTL